MRPVDASHPITQSYGIPNPKYAAGFHTGTDFGCPVGTPVFAPHECTVTLVSTSPEDYGHYVILRGVGGKRVWLFAHLYSYRHGLIIGSRVQAGSTVGYSGETGNATGPHLHAEERHAPFGYRDSQVPTAWVDAGAVSHG